MSVLMKLALLIVLFAQSAAAESRLQGLSGFSREYPRGSLNEYILGPICLSLPAGPLDLSCNPAFLAFEEKRALRFSVAGNSDLGRVNSYREKLASDDKVGIVDSILEQRDPTLARAAVSVWYQHDWWAVGYIPFRGGFATSSRNAAYPEIAADIYRESEIFGKFGLVATDDSALRVGFQLRYVQRQFFRREFALLDAIGDPDTLKIESRRSLYFEPGVQYAFESEWSSTFAATLTGLVIAQDGDRLENRPAVDFGLSTTPPFLGKRLRTSTHFTGSAETNDVFERLRWGANLQMSKSCSLVAELGEVEAGIGVKGHFDSLVLGVGWRTEEIVPDPWQKKRVSTVLFEGGLVF